MLVEAVQGDLPGRAATLAMTVTIVGVAIVNHPRAQAARAADHSPRLVDDPTCGNAFLPMVCQLDGREDS